MSSKPTSEGSNQPNGTAVTAVTPRPTISKEEYLARHYQLFEQLTGFKSWDSWRENVNASSSATDNKKDADLDRRALIYALNLTMAAMDDETYNEVQIQRVIDAKFQSICAANAPSITSFPDSLSRAEHLSSMCERLQDQVNNLEIKYLNSRKAMSALSENEKQMKKRLDVATNTNQRLATMCNALESKIKFMSKDCVSHQTQISQLQQEKKQQEEKLRQAVVPAKTQNEQSLLDEIKVLRKTNVHLLEALSDKKVKGDSKMKLDVPQQLLDMMAELKSDKEAILKQAQSILERQGAQSLITSADMSKPEIEHHPELQNLVLKFNISPQSDTAEKQLDAIRREYPEVLAGKLRKFHDVYVAREKYFMQALRSSKLETMIQTRKLEVLQKRVDTDSKRLKVLSDQVEASAKVEATLTAKVSSLTELTKSLENNIQQTAQALGMKKENEVFLETHLKKMVEMETVLAERNQLLMKKCDKLVAELAMLHVERKQITENFNDTVEKLGASETMCKALLDERDELEFTIIKLEEAIFRLSMSDDVEELRKSQPHPPRPSKQHPNQKGTRKIKYKGKGSTQVQAARSTESKYSKSATVAGSTSGQQNGMAKENDSEGSKTLSVTQSSTNSVQAVQSKEKKQLSANHASPSTKTHSKTTITPSQSNSNDPSNAPEDSLPLSKMDEKDIAKSTSSPDHNLTFNFSKMTPEEITNELGKRFSSHGGDKEFFQRTFGFDITGIPFPEVLEKYSNLGVDKCNDDECTIHHPPTMHETTWDNIINSASAATNAAATGSTESRSTPGEPKWEGNMINGKKVFGPERPPSMTA